MEHTITQGLHYYMSSTIQASTHEIVHSFVRRHTVTNQLHYDTRALLRRLLCRWTDWYVRGQQNEGEIICIHSLNNGAKIESLDLKRSVHVVDITTIDGLLDLIAVGNILEFATALDHHTYEGTPVNPKEHVEQEYVLTRYRTFIRWFMKRFVLMFRDRPVNATYLFKHRILCFATTLGLYVSREHSTVQKVDQVTGMTPATIKKLIRHHIQVHWRDLIPAYDEMVSKPS